MISRTGVEANQFRRRTVRSAAFARTLLWLMGAVTAGAGLADWILQHGVVGLAIAIFGGVLISLGAIQSLLLQRELSHWPERALLWPEGIELALSNGEVRGNSWTDPNLALDLVSRPAPAPSNHEFLMIWIADGAVPPIELSEAGFDAIQATALKEDLIVLRKQRGHRSDPTQTVEIRQSEARKLVADPGTYHGEHPSNSPESN